MGQRPKPVSLRPMSSSEKKWMWGTIIVCLLLIVVGWVFTVGRVVKNQLNIAKTELTQSVMNTSQNALIGSGAKDEIKQDVGLIKKAIDDQKKILETEEQAKNVVINQMKEQIQNQSMYGIEKKN